tara:strand:- start:38 stop:313 length:276 start_codon:yes stop_codon:yes gene_type:complete
MGAMKKLLQNPMIMQKLVDIGKKNRQEMFGAGQKPEDYQQGPTMSQNMGVKSMGVASPNMQDQYQRYVEEEKVRKRKPKKSADTAGETLLG